MTKQVRVAIAVLLAVVAAAAWFTFGTVEIRGRVVDAATGRPIPGAFVALQSAGPFDDDTFSDYVTTMSDGRFVGKAKTHDISVYAWKPGYTVSGTDLLPNSSEYARARVELRIQQKPQMNLVERVSVEDEPQLMKDEQGFSFAGGRTVEADNQDADVIVKYSESEQACVLEACGDGGIALCPSPVNPQFEFDFDNSLRAPIDGYVRSVRLPERYYEYILVYIRTHDGAHYAKAQLTGGNVAVGGEVRRCPYKMTYAFQPTGSRELATRPDEHIKFPVEGYGIDRNSLKLTASN